MRKALVLVLLGKAELVTSDSKKIIRSVRKSYAWPSVVRLVRYVSIPYQRVVLTRKNILRRDAFRCGYCGRGDIALTIDHIIPKARGGGDSWENMVCACTQCNNLKGSRTPAEANMKLLKRPYEPNHILFIKNSIAKIDSNWKPFLFFH